MKADKAAKSLTEVLHTVIKSKDTAKLVLAVEQAFLTGMAVGKNNANPEAVAEDTIMVFEADLIF